eukprot:TRINITY_DN27432_c0_g2_i1.p1 TRINITY_DN27432_c0_g2~~TRINITY_DN27432_c0_g2_i1.p1  ORF type:complete len:238 (-),score=36.78 TRINITY_DN27432_c0_g2_i1:145-858(-)
MAAEGPMLATSPDQLKVAKRTPRVLAKLMRRFGRPSTPETGKKMRPTSEGFLSNRLALHGPAADLAVKKINKDDARCALEVYYKARFEARWCHAECFLRHCTRLKTARKKIMCKGSGNAIQKGEVFLCFEVGDAKANWLPVAAKRITRDIVKLCGEVAATGWASAGLSANISSGESEISWSACQSVLKKLMESEDVSLLGAHSQADVDPKPERKFKRLRRLDTNPTNETAFDLAEDS